MELLTCVVLVISVLQVFGNGGLLGAPGDADKNDDSISKLAHFGLGEINKQSEQSGLKDSRDFVEVLHVKKQIVAGTKYFISLHVVNGNKDEVCKIVVFVPLPYMKASNELLSHDCGPYKSSPLPDDVIAQAVATAVEYYNAGSNSLKRSVKTDVQEISSKDVGGLATFSFTIQFGETTCDNNMDFRGKGIEVCPLNNNGMKYNCKYTVTYQPEDKRQYVVNNQECVLKEDMKVDLLHKLGGLVLRPQDLLPILPQQPVNKADEPVFKRQKKDLPKDNIVSPLLSDIGQKVLGALRIGIMDNPQLLGKDGHDAVQHGIDKLNHLFGGYGHDMKKHGMEKLAKLLGQDGHDLKEHLTSLFGGDDHDMKSHGILIGGDDHDMKSHGILIGGDDHDMKSHGSLIGGDDHDLCHIGHFEAFIKKHGKTYPNDNEMKTRFTVFCSNMKIVRDLNKSEQDTATYGATKFADLTPAEFRSQYLSKKDWSQIPNHFGASMKKAAIPKSAPSAFDWREKGAVTPVKNQGSCGSCWAFSTTGNIEGQWSIKKQQLVSLSEQELVDCDKLDDGCNGGLPSNAYQSIMKLGGLESEKAYKYEGDDEKCTFNRSKVSVKISGAVNISSNENNMAAWLAKNGPISIGINAMAMQFYFGGISHPWKIFCNPKNLDHGVLIVGYGVEGSEPYWIIKNSWGPDWGEKGYYRAYRGSGVCGLNTMCTSAVV